MAKIKSLKAPIKTALSNRFKARITHIGLSFSTAGPSETPVPSNFEAKMILCGNKELHELKFDATTPSEIIVNNALDNPPFLLFTVAATEVPRKFVLWHYFHGPNLYYKDITIDRLSPSARIYDSACYIITLMIAFKGDGEG